MSTGAGRASLRPPGGAASRKYISPPDGTGRQPLQPPAASSICLKTRCRDALTRKTCCHHAHPARRIAAPGTGRDPPEPGHLVEEVGPPPCWMRTGRPGRGTGRCLPAAGLPCRGGEHATTTGEMLQSICLTHQTSSHIFGGQVDTAQEVLASWERSKANAGTPPPAGACWRCQEGLPPLMRADKIHTRRKAGFDGRRPGRR